MRVENKEKIGAKKMSQYPGSLFLLLANPANGSGADEIAFLVFEPNERDAPGKLCSKY